MAVHIPLRAVFAASHTFTVLRFRLCGSQTISWFPFDFFSAPGVFRTVLLSLRVCEFSCFPVVRKATRYEVSPCESVKTCLGTKPVMFPGEFCVRGSRWAPPLVGRWSGCL